MISFFVLLIIDSEPFFYELDDKETEKVARDPNFFLQVYGYAAAKIRHFH